MLQDVLSVFRLLLADLDSPRALTVRILIDHGEWDQLVSLRVDPQHYVDSDRYFRDAIATDFLRKLEALPTSYDRRREAVATFIAAEKQCYRTNSLIRPIVEFPSGPLEASEWRIARFLRRVKIRISRVLGSLPGDLELGRFGPGATLEDKGRSSTLVHKMQSRPTVTPNAYGVVMPYWERTAWCRSLAGEYPNRSDPKRVPGNRFTSVRKTAKTHRGICVEPSLNVFYQLAVGSEIRWRLKVRADIDLNHGQPRQRTLARSASLGASELATIDLSSASDTVSYYLVKAVLPADWFQLLESLRSPFTMMGDRRVHLQKFSSMGNGFTFELETLIFWAIARECASSDDDTVSVYGDDIIVESKNAEVTLEWLKLLGFTPNLEKTFTSGPFRESCGGDYFNGAAVRPFFLKDIPTSPPEWFVVYNGLARLDYFPVTRRAMGRILDLLPSRLRRLKGPSWLGDAVLHSPDRSSWSVRIKDGIVWGRGIRPLTRTMSLGGLPPTVVLALALYGVPSTGYAPRGAPVGYKETWYSFS